MYDWLAEELRDSTQLLTVSRRLAQTLHEEFARLQVNAGHKAWRTPAILYWRTWLQELLRSPDLPAGVVSPLSSGQSQLLWESCLRRETDDPLVNLTTLAREAGETMNILREWSIAPSDCLAAAHNDDHGLFARAAAHYDAVLAREGWSDRAGLATVFADLVDEVQLKLPERIVLVGFDRLTPQLQKLVASLERRQIEVHVRAGRSGRPPTEFVSFENQDAELRAAGHWARRELERDPEQRIAIVAPGLEINARRAARLVREGLNPGWQSESSGSSGDVQVSYGLRLADLPAITIALLLVEWLFGDLTTPQLSMILRSSFVALGSVDARSRVELDLRTIPTQSWSPMRFLACFEKQQRHAELESLFAAVQRFARRRDELPARQSPEGWSREFAEALEDCAWPAAAEIGSEESQLLNRWKEALNELASLELVAPTMFAAEAHARLSSLTKEALVHAESEVAPVQLLGPLEAAGQEFDQLWISGCSATNWPGPGRPLQFVARELQRERGMPDADPTETLQQSQRVWNRLLGSAATSVVSYAAFVDEAEQAPCGFLAGIEEADHRFRTDPGWFASTLAGSVGMQTVVNETVPVSGPDETISGGAATIQRQREHPFAAFATGRLSVREIAGFGDGLTPVMRGILLHGALRALYAELPSRDELAAWPSSERKQRVRAAIRQASAPLLHCADELLSTLLTLEQVRMERLLEQVLDGDIERDDFRVLAVERKVTAEIGGARFRFQIDRIDMVKQETVLLDYKTGRRRKFRRNDGDLHEIQLAAYSCAIDPPTGGLGIISVDRRDFGFDLIGSAVSDISDWQVVLSRWQSEVETLAKQIQNGDVRVPLKLPKRLARSFALLSRYAELLREHS